MSTFAEAKAAAEDYLSEAEWCADGIPARAGKSQVLGFAAMSLALACVVAFGDALIGCKSKRPSDAQCIKQFCTHMDYHRWLLQRAAQPGGRTSEQLLIDVRNALIHALSLPQGVCLAPDLQAYDATPQGEFPTAIVPGLFVKAVKATITEIAGQHANQPFEPWCSKGTQRSLVRIDSSTSASTPG